jgi:hypothetical protein
MTEDKKCVVIFKNIYWHIISFGLAYFKYASDRIFLTLIVIHVNLRSPAMSMSVTFFFENVI